MEHLPARPWTYRPCRVWKGDMYIFDAAGGWITTIPRHQNSKEIAELIVKAVNQDSKKGRKKT